MDTFIFSLLGLFLGSGPEAEHGFRIAVVFPVVYVRCKAPHHKVKIERTPRRRNQHMTGCREPGCGLDCAWIS